MTLEHLTIRCSELAVGEDERSKEGEAGDPCGSSMQGDAATRRRSQAKRYRSALSALIRGSLLPTRPFARTASLLCRLWRPRGLTFKLFEGKAKQRRLPSVQRKGTIECPLKVRLTVCLVCHFFLAPVFDSTIIASGQSHFYSIMRMVSRGKFAKANILCPIIPHMRFAAGLPNSGPSLPVPEVRRVLPNS